MVGHKTLAKRELEAVDFFFRCICRFKSVSDSNLRIWVNSLSKGVTPSHEPPTHTGCSVLSEWISESGVISWDIVKPELLLGLFSNVARCNSSEK